MALPTPTDGAGPRYFGVYPAIVTNIVDQDAIGRVQVRFPWLGTDGDRDVRAWATLCSPYADDEQGLEILPEVDSQVVVAFEAGDLRRPYVLGAAWNGKTTLPHSAESANNIRILRSRSDSRLEFDDTAGSPKVSITMASGHRIVLEDAPPQITIQHSNGCVLRMTAAGSIEVNANVSLDVTAPSVNVTAPVSTFSGIVHCQTLITDSFVVSPAYTPGVGNVW
ncbi:MAG: phage baseplate assembly protein V [Jatrophihabitantaceae bacterium]